MNINDITTLQMMVRGRQLTTHQRGDAFQELERVEKFIKSNQLQHQEVKKIPVMNVLVFGDMAKVNAFIAANADHITVVSMIYWTNEDLVMFYLDNNG